MSILKTNDKFKIGTKYQFFPNHSGQGMVCTYCAHYIAQNEEFWMNGYGHDPYCSKQCAMNDEYVE